MKKIIKNKYIYLLDNFLADGPFKMVNYIGKHMSPHDHNSSSITFSELRP
jgi:hypothetical protein